MLDDREQPAGLLTGDLEVQTEPADPLQAT
jgi:hypothetical protein